MHISKIVVTSPGIGVSFDVRNQLGLDAFELALSNLAFERIQQRIGLFTSRLLGLAPCGFCKQKGGREKENNGPASENCEVLRCVDRGKPLLVCLYALALICHNRDILSWLFSGRFNHK